jgi:hypothetical protein
MIWQYGSAWPLGVMVMTWRRAEVVSIPRPCCWFLLVILTLTPLSTRAQTAQLTGNWVVDYMNMGARQTLSFRPSGTYEYKIWQIQPGGRRVVQAEDGNYAVQGNRLVLYPRGGGAQNYGWELTRDPYVGDIMLRLYDAAGNEVAAFYTQ